MNDNIFPIGPRLPLTPSWGDAKRDAADAALEDDTASEAGPSKRPREHPGLRTSNRSDLPSLFVPMSEVAHRPRPGHTHALAMPPPVLAPPHETLAYASSQPPPLVAPELPVAELALAKREHQIFSAVTQAAVSPPMWFGEFLDVWLRHANRSVDGASARRLVRALAEKASLRAGAPLVTETLKAIDLTCATFGDCIDGSLRAPWKSCMRFHPQADAVEAPEVWQRRELWSEWTQRLRLTTNVTCREAVTKKFLLALCRAGDNGHALWTLLDRHPAVKLQRGEFAELVLLNRSESWLYSIDWHQVTQLIDTLLALRLPTNETRDLIQGLLRLRRADIKQVEFWLEILRRGTSAPQAGALELALFRAIEKIGYSAVQAFKQAFNKNFSATDNQRIITALGQFVDGNSAYLTAQVFRQALLNDRQAAIKVLEDFSGPFAESRHGVFQKLNERGKSLEWIDRQVQLAKHGTLSATAADLHAAQLLLGGDIVGENLALTAANGATVLRSLPEIDLLLRAAQAWRLSAPGQPGYVDLAATQAGEAVLATQGRIIRYVCRLAEGHGPQAHVNCATALSQVPEIELDATLRQLLALHPRLGASVGTQMLCMDAIVAVVRNNVSDVAVALLSHHVYPGPQAASPTFLNKALTAATALQHTIPMLQHLAIAPGLTRSRADVLVAVANYATAFGENIEAVVPRLQRISAMVMPRGQPMRINLGLSILLAADLRLGDGLSRLAERMVEANVPTVSAWNILFFMGRCPMNGVFARSMAAACQTDQTLAALASIHRPEQLRAFLAQLTAEVRQRLGNDQNVHNSVRMRATEGAAAFLRDLGGGLAALDIPQTQRAIGNFISQIANRQGEADTIWRRQRNVGARTTVENAAYVFSGPYTPRLDLSPSVTATPALLEVCALVWRAIDLYNHPSGDVGKTRNEQSLMREDMVIGLSECVRDEDGGRVCPVGFKQRVIGILQGEERYPQILIDAVNAAQLLTVVAEEFSTSLETDAPTPTQLARFVDRARELAAARFRDEPVELEKFRTGLNTWVAMDYNYQPEPE